MPPRARPSGARSRSRRWRARRSASSTRGVDYWKGGSDHRLFTVRNGYPVRARPARQSASARSAPAAGCRLVPEGARSFGWSSGPIVVGDVVVIAGNLDGAGDGGQKWKGSPPEDVRGFDARSGKLLWTFHVVPRDGRVRRRHMGQRLGEVLRRSRFVVLRIGGRSARLRLHTADRADRRVLRGIPAGRQPLLQRPGRARRQDREARLALSDGPSRPVGVRHRRSADAGRDHGRWEDGSRR